MRICCVAQETQTGALHQPRRGGVGREKGRRFKSEDIYIYIYIYMYVCMYVCMYVYLWLIHVEI